jgi:hypothetical protein
MLLVAIVVSEGKGGGLRMFWVDRRRLVASKSTSGKYAWTMTDVKGGVKEAKEIKGSLRDLSRHWLDCECLNESYESRVILPSFSHHTW